MGCDGYMTKPLTREERTILTEKARSLKPSLIVARDGVAENIVWGLNKRLFDYQLVKVKFNTTQRAEIEKMSNELAAKTDSIVLSVQADNAVFFKQHPNVSISDLCERTDL